MGFLQYTSFRTVDQQPHDVWPSVVADWIRSSLGDCNHGGVELRVQNTLLVLRYRIDELTAVRAENHRVAAPYQACHKACRSSPAR